MEEFYEQQVFFAYLAGIIDGEGNISILKDKNYYQMVVRIANTDKKLVDFIASNARVPPHVYLQKRQEKGYKKLYVLRWNGADVEIILQRAKKYLIVKKPQAEVALRFQGIKDAYGRNNPKPKEYYKRLKEMHDKMKGMNPKKKGLKKLISSLEHLV